MQRTGIVDRTVDREFDDEYERFKLLEKKVEKLTKEAKGYLDSLRGMHAYKALDDPSSGLHLFLF
jgi:hypothetical protein